MKPRKKYRKRERNYKQQMEWERAKWLVTSTEACWKICPAQGPWPPPSLHCQPKHRTQLLTVFCKSFTLGYLKLARTSPGSSHSTLPASFALVFFLACQESKIRPVSPPQPTSILIYARGTHLGWATGWKTQWPSHIWIIYCCFYFSH